MMLHLISESWKCQVTLLWSTVNTSLAAFTVLSVTDIYMFNCAVSASDRGDEAYTTFLPHFSTLVWMMNSAWLSDLWNLNLRQNRLMNRESDSH